MFKNNKFLMQCLLSDFYVYDMYFLYKYIKKKTIYFIQIYNFCAYLYYMYFLYQYIETTHLFH